MLKPCGDWFRKACGKWQWLSEISVKASINSLSSKGGISHILKNHCGSPICSPVWPQTLLENQSLCFSSNFQICKESSHWQTLNLNHTRKRMLGNGILISPAAIEQLGNWFIMRWKHTVQCRYFENNNNTTKKPWSQKLQLIAVLLVLFKEWCQWWLPGRRGVGGLVKGKGGPIYGIEDLTLDDGHTVQYTDDVS